MKNLFIIILFALGVSSCGPHMYKTYSAGKDDVSYIIVLTNGSSFSDVSVIVDDQIFEVDKVYKVKATRKAHPIIVSPGKHQVKVTSKGQTLVEEDVFIGLQETKKIILQ